MSKVTHTPGPWWASGLEVGTVPMMDVKIARVSGANFDEAKANARLIAASPDLLDALTILVDNVMHAMPSAAHLGPVVKARAAIVKARGEA